MSTTYKRKLIHKSHHPEGCYGFYDDGKLYRDTKHIATFRLKLGLTCKQALWLIKNAFKDH